MNYLTMLMMKAYTDFADEEKNKHKKFEKMVRDHMLGRIPDGDVKMT